MSPRLLLTRILPFLALALALPAGAAEAEGWVLSPEGLGTYSAGGAGKMPPAALIRFPGRGPDAKAYALGCGHCTGMPVGAYVSDRPATNKIYLKEASGRMHGIPVAKIVYGTQTKVDLVLLELGLTYREIEAQYGITARNVARAPLRGGEKIAFFNLEGIQYCRIDGVEARHPFNDEGTDYLENNYLYYGCVSIDGYSGSILVGEESNEVVGLNVGGSYPEMVDGKVTSFGSEVASLYSCVDEAGTFRVDRPACSLRIGERFSGGD